MNDENSAEGFDDPVTPEIKDEIRGALNALTRNVEGFSPRGGQNKFIAETARTLAGSHMGKSILVAEAPTGTGKGMGYLLGSIPIAKAQGKRLVIATATVALQEQLIYHDLPLLRDRGEMEFTFGLAKGRRRYVCNRNLANLTGSDSRQGELDVGEAQSAAWDHAPSEWEIETVGRMESSLESSEGFWEGDLDQWDEELPKDLRQALTTDQAGCLNRNCPFFTKCAYVKARAALGQVDVIVANIDLVLADLNAGGGRILPPPEETFYIFDEGHHLHHKAMAIGADESSIQGGAEIVERTRKTIHDILGLLRGTSRADKEAAETANDMAREIIDRLDDAERLIESLFPTEARDGHTLTKTDDYTRWRFRLGDAPDDLRDQADDVTSAVFAMLGLLDKKKAALETCIRENSISIQATTKIFQSVGVMTNRLMSMLSAWGGFAEYDAPERPPAARWIDHFTPKRKQRPTYRVAYARTSAADWLRANLFDKAEGVVITSATLTSLGRFDRMRENCGLRDDDGTQYLRIPSPFNYQQNAELFIPGLAIEPRRTDEHTQAVVDYLNTEIDPDVGTLVLFSSRWQMKKVAKAVDKRLREQLFVQGDQPKAEIVIEHAKRIRRGEGSVIFGLASFAEGVDLPGALCVHVIIAKIPFAVPDSPVDATYAEYLESNGRNPFMEVSVPDAGVRLTQACGRLIRSETDHGRISLLDRRVVTKPYGRLFLNGLPPYRVTIEDRLGKSA